MNPIGENEKDVCQGVARFYVSSLDFNNRGAPTPSLSYLTFTHRKCGQSDQGTDQQNTQWVV